MTYSSSGNDIPALAALNDDQVADYLRRHPDFLVDKPALLADMHLPHQPGGKAISLVERQVAVLRERNMDMRHRLNQLLENARVNDFLFEKTKRLLLALLDSEQFDDGLDALFFSFQNEFSIHFARIILVADANAAFPEPANQQARLLSLVELEKNLPSLLNNQRAVCGQLDESEQRFIFENKAEQVGSTAVSPLRIDNQLLGFLAIGNRDPQYYRSSMNTLFLNFIAEALGRVLVNLARN